MSNHNNNNNNNNFSSNNSNNQNHSDWKDELKDKASDIADNVMEDARDLATEAKEEIQDLAREAKVKYDTIPVEKKMELNHWGSLVIAVVAGLVIGLVVGWNRGHDKGVMMQNNHMSSQEMMHQMSANLDGLSGSDLEQQFVQDMIAHHQGAVDMATKLVSGSGVSDELRAFGANIIRVQTAEIEQMKGWLK